jgi:hypothetical protein
MKKKTREIVDADRIPWGKRVLVTIEDSGVVFRGEGIVTLMEIPAEGKGWRVTLEVKRFPGAKAMRETAAKEARRKSRL